MVAILGYNTVVDYYKLSQMAFVYGFRHRLRLAPIWSAHRRPHAHNGADAGRARSRSLWWGARLF